VRIDIEGAVQGVGFRPFVYRLARDLGLRGWVVNDPRGVSIEAQGMRPDLDRFVKRLRTQAPAAAVVERLTSTPIRSTTDPGFEIRTSDRAGRPMAQMLPDIATCDDCLEELFDPHDRRYRYPFTNCTNCGPRLSIIRGLPYDRSRTTMDRFTLCPACRREYHDPANRRFHAQPNACADCGPRLEMRDTDGTVTTTRDDALIEATRAIAGGEIVAVKGLGGFHLMVDARNGRAINNLRTRKLRREKPLALIARDLEQARQLCEVDDAAAALLRSAIAPIVLLPRRAGGPAHEQVAPNSPILGLMLPYTPLHHLLMGDLDFPVVATSGNLSDEPICIDEDDALERLGGIADRFLVHDRPIARQVDDSIVRVFSGATTLLRRARGHAPRPVVVKQELPAVLAVGAHLKNAVAVAVGRRVFVSQHIGDLETPESIQAFKRIIGDFLGMYCMQPKVVACDLHPGYVSTRWAEEFAAREGLPRIEVQHHHAHLASCLADNGHAGPALGVIWDGTGHGTDGTVWGGEFLAGDAGDYRRVAHLRPFRLPGGEKAIREPRRAAAALLWELDGAAALDRDGLACVRSFSAEERKVVSTMLERGVHAPRTSSMGRLFDGMAALLDLYQRTTFEGQAAMALELAAERTVRSSYSIALNDGVLDWRPLIRETLEDLRRGTATGTIAARFHNALVNAILAVAQRSGQTTVALSGGCFQNRLLVERVSRRLGEAGFEVLVHRNVPPNDGGIALGQIAVASARMTVCAWPYRVK